MTGSDSGASKAQAVAGFSFWLHDQLPELTIDQYRAITEAFRDGL